MDTVREELKALGFSVNEMPIEHESEDSPMLEDINRLYVAIQFVSQKFEEERPWFTDAVRAESVNDAIKDSIHPSELEGINPSCIVCFEPFNDSAREAVRVTCGHILCKDCLWIWCFTERRDTCPHCRCNLVEDCTARVLSVRADCPLDRQAIIHQLNLLASHADFLENEALEVSWHLDRAQWVDILADLNARVIHARFRISEVGEYDYVCNRIRAAMRGLFRYIKHQEIPDELRARATCEAARESSTYFRSRACDIEIIRNRWGRTWYLWKDLRALVRIYEKELGPLNATCHEANSFSRGESMDIMVPTSGATPISKASEMNAVFATVFTILHYPFQKIGQLIRYLCWVADIV
jgi:hypothetical protein